MKEIDLRADLNEYYGKDAPEFKTFGTVGELNFRKINAFKRFYILRIKYLFHKRKFKSIEITAD